MEKHRPKILLARFDLDGHDKGIVFIMNALRNAGMEIVYIHFSNSKEIVKSAIQEDVDLIGITSSLGQHLLVSSMLMEELNNNRTNIPVIIGGVIPNIDVPKLINMGIKKVFGPGSTPQEAVAFASQITGQTE
ncbi:MAG: methylmalonyl-CoA mutase [Chloroflexi bacterium CG_4_8_14_3_um_filter_45_15]|nr:MAG: methylmalonyl-CoA mutase [Chloroflexi bacterium CG_4_8_14_3_um_filter_45_15]